jgi:hypothetical protein
VFPACAGRKRQNHIRNYKKQWFNNRIKVNKMFSFQE